jgi:hypothetical protein
MIAPERTGGKTLLARKTGYRRGAFAVLTLRIFVGAAASSPAGITVLLDES